MKLRIVAKLLPALLLSAVAATSNGQTKPAAKIPITPTAEIQKALDAAAKLPPAKRLDAYIQVATAALKANDYVGYDSAISAIRDADLVLHKPEDAHIYLQAQITAGEKAADVRWQATAIEKVGELLAATGKAAAALSMYERALALRTRADDLFGESESLRDLADLSYASGHPDRERTYYEHLVPITQELGDRRGEAVALNNIAWDSDALGQKQKALDFYGRALPIEREVGDRRGVAITLNSIGKVYDDLGQKQTALDYYAKALPMSQEVGDRRSEATTLHNIGAVYNALGKKHEALDYYARALPIRREVGDRNGEANTLNNIGSVYDDLGQKHEALDYYAKALPIEKEGRDGILQGVTLNNIGKVYDDLGQKQMALDYYARALPKEKDGGDRRMESTTLSNIGAAYEALGQKQKALDYYAKALPIKKEVGDRSGEAATLNNIGVVYDALGEKQKALDYYAKVLPIRKEVGDRNGEASTLNNIGRSYRSQHRPQLGIAFGKRAVNVTQGLRADIKGLDKGSQRSFRDSVSAYYRDLADWLAEAGRLAEAEQVLDLLKDEEYFGYLRRRGVKSEYVDLTTREATWMKTYDELGDGLAAIGTEREALVKIPVAGRTAEQKKRLTQLEDKSSKAAAAFNMFIAQTEAAFKTAGADRDRLEDVKQSRVLQSMLIGLRKSHPAALYTLETSDGVRVIVSVPGSPLPRQAKKMVSGAELNKKILAFREALTDPTVDPRPLGAELYDLLVRPIEKDLKAAKIKTLMWSLDGTLRYIPIWALYDSKSQQYLIEKYPSSLFTPRTVAGLLVRPHAWTGAEFGVTKGGSVGDVKFDPLPGVANELAGVHRSLSGPAPLLDNAFTYSAFQEALDAQPTVVHVATHFRFKPNDDVNSFLLLGKGESLSVEKFNNIPDGALSSVDLLVLSACETEMGGNADGSEFEGFARLAQQKGAGAVLATLWPVADESTAMLMGEFYRLRKAHPEWTKLEALRQAQLEMLHGNLGGGQSPSRGTMASAKPHDPKAKPWPKGMPRYSHPYYWAPFVLTGNWQ